MWVSGELLGLGNARLIQEFKANRNTMKKLVAESLRNDPVAIAPQQAAPTPTGLEAYLETSDEDEEMVDAGGEGSNVNKNILFGTPPHNPH